MTTIPPLSIPNLLSAEKILTNVECHTNAHQEETFSLIITVPFRSILAHEGRNQHFPY